ncbi:MAG: hypothetical protein HOD92_09520 [Deltaproteobacteria bacterium]|jgi:hypothetical protein|nr:hypothetical protein [Deltaproteobacteria bacterium]MBT4525597.1 hypothetical protein [Deltaproteobacteria bacterium]
MSNSKLEYIYSITIDPQFEKGVFCKPICFVGIDGHLRVIDDPEFIKYEQIKRLSEFRYSYVNDENTCVILHEFILEVISSALLDLLTVPGLPTSIKLVYHEKEYQIQGKQTYSPDNIWCIEIFQISQSEGVRKKTFIFQMEV